MKKIVPMFVMSMVVLFGRYGVCGESAPTVVNPVDIGLSFIDTSIENASPLYWEIDADGNIHVYLIYDYERDSPNRANGHWHFQVQAKKGSDLTFILHNFANVWNGKMSSVVSDRMPCYISLDGKNWEVIKTERYEKLSLKFQVHMESESLYIARIEPYRISDLNALMDEIKSNPLVDIQIIGKTVEGRELEIIRVGNPDSPHSVFLRVRAHPWETGGNWLVQGMIRNLLRKDERIKKYLDRYCVYIMPMSNKDGVAHGRTRFNSRGMDLNRKWDTPADPELCPENHYLEKWLQSMTAKGKKPDLAIDFHNDGSGLMHISRPNVELERYLANMKRLEELMTELTWFTEGSTGGNYRNPGTLGEGFLERFGIYAIIQELNDRWIAGLNKEPFGKDWELLGEQYCEVFFRYFGELKKE